MSNKVRSNVLRQNQREARIFRDNQFLLRKICAIHCSRSSVPPFVSDIRSVGTPQLPVQEGNVTRPGYAI